MTSFEPPDTGLLVEHLLPSLLGASHSLSQEFQERAMFFGELGTALEALHGRLSVISSPPRGAREDSQYPWLWRYVSHFTVGAESRAVQHAKLWAFHWKVGDHEHLDLYISSTNLTASAFKDQVQAGWQASLQLSHRSNQRTRRTWGNLLPFLEALGTSAGAIAAARIERLVTLLGRAECPANVTFIASIPGSRSAVRQLKQFEPTAIHVLTPTIGEWDDPTLSAWGKDVGVTLGKVHLKWISTTHPWAAKSGWALSTTAKATLEANGVHVEHLPAEARFTKQHRDADHRWSHAKLYLLRSRRKRRLLVTSANWSPSAWGAGKYLPRNFELGVVIETDWTALEMMGEPFGTGTVPFCSEEAGCEPDDPKLQWAEASWDGKTIHLLARSSDSSTPIAALLTFTGRHEERLSLVDSAATMPWKDLEHTPLTARFLQGTETMEVDILDLRSPVEFAKTPLPEVDPAISTALREAFLLERYGGVVVDPDSIPGLGRAHQPPANGASPGDYSVQAWIDARAGFDVIDNWRAALAEAANDPLPLERVRLDGVELRAIFRQRDAPAAQVVSDELGWRLEEET